METSTPKRKRKSQTRRGILNWRTIVCEIDVCARVPSCEQVPNPFEKSLKRFWIWTKCKNSHLAFFSHIICANGNEQGSLLTNVMVGFLYGTNTVYFLSFFLPIHVIAIFLSPFDFILKHVYFLCKDTNNGYKYSPGKNRKTVLQMIVVYRSALLIKYSCT